MNYNFTEGCRMLLGGARSAAIDRGVDYVGTEHILLSGLEDARLRAMLERLGVRHDEVRAAMLELLPERDVRQGPARAEEAGGARRWGRRKPATGELPYTSRAKKVLELAMAEAREMGDGHVGTEHILAGMIREEKGIAAEVLQKFGVTLPRARAVRDVEASSSRSPLRVIIDDASDQSIYEQIVAQITEAVATGSVQPGERLPTVRQLADELDIAPGTVARAYTELERQKLVVTEGARGTRVADRQPEAPTTDERAETLVGLLRPVAVAAFHLGSNAAELRAALDEAMRGIFDRDDRAA